MEDRYNVECCELMCAHEEIVEKVQKEMPESGSCMCFLRRKCACAILRRCWA